MRTLPNLINTSQELDDILCRPSESLTAAMRRIEGDIMILESLKNIVPIGRATFLKGHITQELINLTINTLEKYKKALAEYEIKQVFVIATTAVREANRRRVCQR